MLGLWLFSTGLAIAQQPDADSPETQSTAPDADTTKDAPEPESGAAPTPVQGRSAGQNLLGQADTARGEGRRNENIQINLVDNNAARDANQRVGPTATIIDEFRVERSYYSSEFGNAGRGPIHAQPQRGVGTHGNLFLNHNNSIFNARTFFQAGPVQPSG